MGGGGGGDARTSARWDYLTRHRSPFESTSRIKGSTSDQEGSEGPKRDANAPLDRIGGTQWWPSAVVVDKNKKGGTQSRLSLWAVARSNNGSRLQTVVETTKPSGVVDRTVRRRSTKTMSKRTSHNLARVCPYSTNSAPHPPPLPTDTGTSAHHTHPSLPFAIRWRRLRGPRIGRGWRAEHGWAPPGDKFGRDGPRPTTQQKAGWPRGGGVARAFWDPVSMRQPCCSPRALGATFGPCPPDLCICRGHPRT